MPPRFLPRSFFLPAPDIVARDLLGKLLVRHLDGQDLVCRITETEAYFGSDDPAAHSAAGRTARTEVLFGPPGHAYVYFIYGMHFCLNISCEPEGHAGCVLVRAAEPLAGLDIMAHLRGLPPHPQPRLLTTGPGRLCRALAITRPAHNALDLTDPASPLRLADDGHPAPPVTTTARIGIRKAAERPLRFYITGSPFVSGTLR